MYIEHSVYFDSWVYCSDKCVCGKESNSSSDHPKWKTHGKRITKVYHSRNKVHYFQLSDEIEYGIPKYIESTASWH